MLYFMGDEGGYYFMGKEKDWFGLVKYNVMVMKVIC